MATHERSPDPRRRTMRQRTERARRIGFLAGFAALFVAAIPLIGYYVVFVKPTTETALVVNDQLLSWGEYANRVRMLVAQGQRSGQFNPEDMTTLVYGTMDDLEHEAIILQYAPQLGVRATSPQVQQRIRSVVLGAEANEPDGPSEAEFRERYRQFLNLLQIDDEEYRQIARAAVLRQGLREYLKARIPAKTIHRHLFLMRLSTPVEVREAQARLAAGEDFSAVARDMSEETDVEENGGDAGWFPKGAKADFDPYLFELADGEVSEPIITQTGTFLIKAVDEPQLRDLSEDDRRTLEVNVLSTWLFEKRMELVADKTLRRDRFTTDRYNWVLDHVTQDRELFPRRGSSG